MSCEKMTVLLPLAKFAHLPKLFIVVGHSSFVIVFSTSILLWSQFANQKFLHEWEWAFNVFAMKISNEAASKFNVNSWPCSAKWTWWENTVGFVHFKFVGLNTLTYPKFHLNHLSILNAQFSKWHSLMKIFYPDFAHQDKWKCLKKSLASCTLKHFCDNFVKFWMETLMQKSVSNYFGSVSACFQKCCQFCQQVHEKAKNVTKHFWAHVKFLVTQCNHATNSNCSCVAFFHSTDCHAWNAENVWTNSANDDFHC